MKYVLFFLAVVISNSGQAAPLPGQEFCAAVRNRSPQGMGFAAAYRKLAAEYQVHNDLIQWGDRGLAALLAKEVGGDQGLADGLFVRCFAPDSQVQVSDVGVATRFSYYVRAALLSRDKSLARDYMEAVFP